MGHISDRFSGISYFNEEEVSTKLVLPLLTDFLGYADIEILLSVYNLLLAYLVIVKKRLMRKMRKSSRISW